MNNYVVGQRILTATFDADEEVRVGDRREIRQWPGFVMAVYEVADVYTLLTGEGRAIEGVIVEVVDEGATE